MLSARVDKTTAEVVGRRLLNDIRGLGVDGTGSKSAERPKRLLYIGGEAWFVPISKVPSQKWGKLIFCRVVCLSISETGLNRREDAQGVTIHEPYDANRVSQVSSKNPQNTTLHSRRQ